MQIHVYTWQGTLSKYTTARDALRLCAGTGVKRLFQAIADDMAGISQPPPAQPEARQTSPIRLGEFKFSDTFLNSPRTPRARAATPPGTPHAKPQRSSCC